MNKTEQERQSPLKLIVLLAWIILFGAISVLGSSTETSMNFDNPNTISILYIGQVFGVIVLFIAPALLFSAFWTRSGIAYTGIKTKTSFTALLIGSLGILLAFPLINWLSEVNQHMHLPSAFSGIEVWMKNSEAKAAEMTTIFTRGTSAGSLILNLFVVAFMAALSEELFFRGVLQKVLLECIRNKHVAIWIGAICFSAFHMQFFGFFPRMLMGAYLGYLFLWSGSLWPGIVAHFVNNGMAVLLIWLINRGVIPENIDKLGMESTQWVYVVCSAVMVIVSLIMVYRVEKKRRSVIITETGI